MSNRPTGFDNMRESTWRGVVSIAAVALLCSTSFFEMATRAEFDFLARLTAPIAPASGVLVVGLDAPSSDEPGGSPPIPLRLLVPLVDELEEAGAAAVGIDFAYAEPQTPAGDAALRFAFNGYVRTVIAEAPVSKDASPAQHDLQHLSTIFPGARQADADLLLDADGVARRVPDQPDAMWRELVKVHGGTVAAPSSGALLRYYASPTPFAYAHFAQALHAREQLEPKAVRGQIVLVGPYTAFLVEADHVRTPLSALGAPTQSSVFVQATAVLNALNHDWIVPTPWPAAWLLAATALLLAALRTRHWTALRAVTVSIKVATLVIVGTLLAFVAGAWLSALPALLALTFNLTLGVMRHHQTASKQR